MSNNRNYWGTSFACAAFAYSIIKFACLCGLDLNLGDNYDVYYENNLNSL
ncbi:hypothetical protein XBFFL1_770097 [Xenorhabdus bovienii str. feltiae Florida]|uniref:Uncharacterized protein n=3 Tax=Xenorhabdus bovienii TaxID=40576 RepID=A0A0B6XAR0_XENBV|nr:hypothetical protein XBFFR1_1910002 [Xenorhabdus bovienii str. feltiae France]CDG94613.1 hypothetical protein XBFFL1_770097 [Xenorhabdus bovienii str. feltiae Florida]CDH02694.1 hypothetical protein XBFM1_320032 [Xenorhabdus bovienii str. feltiae Moldova]CDH22948.1 hypothetical protein XBKB1_1420022 [Xenorhabdus bovienii str. kraussei Becker Underwood]CDM89813.1 protein of unknown function [Xenorhabdus bovienii]